MPAWLLLALALGSAQVDPASRAEFSLHTRWGQTLRGTFAGVEGRVAVDAAGQRRVQLALDATTVEISGHPRYTAFARGPRFFDVARHPRIEFASDPYSPDLLLDGGDLTGELRLNGQRRRERFVVAPSRCDRPGLDCDIVAFGTVRRSVYGMDGWAFALRDPVRFALRVRLQGGGA
jgi:polyisoprenoid-binding protein YceI